MTVRSGHFWWHFPIKRAAVISAAAAVTMPLALGGALTAPAPSADAQEYVQEDSGVAVQHPGWESLSTRRDDRVGFELTTNPGSVELDERFNVGMEISNDTMGTLENLQVTARRGPQVTDAESAQQQLAHGDFPYYGSTVFPPAMAPGD